MRSQRGFVAALVLLLALPITVLYQMLFSKGADTVIHVVLATGSLLLASAVFDFNKLAKWINWIGCLAASAEAAIFLLQGVSHLIQNDSLTYLAYQGLGQWPERLLMDFVIFWCLALLLMDSQGKMRILGFVAVSSVVGLEIYSYRLSYLGASLTTQAPSLKLLYLLPFVWLLFESKKKISLLLGWWLACNGKATRTLAPGEEKGQTSACAAGAG
jgi:hypothetical protein